MVLRILRTETLAQMTKIATKSTTQDTRTKLYTTSNSVDGSALKILAQKFSVVIAIMVKHCWESLFLEHHVQCKQHYRVLNE